jgi:glyoxylase-like metal-dependent hydrolase (beta-lactamase superfamily II)
VEYSLGVVRDKWNTPSVALDPFSEIAPGVLVATSGLFVNTTTVVAGPDGSCLVIDAALTVAEISGLAASLSARGLRPVAAWSTHPHWDHMLWHSSLGDVPSVRDPGGSGNRQERARQLGRRRGGVRARP